MLRSTLTSMSHLRISLRACTPQRLPQARAKDIDNCLVWTSHRVVCIVDGKAAYDIPVSEILAAQVSKQPFYKKDEVHLDLKAAAKPAVVAVGDKAVASFVVALCEKVISERVAQLLHARAAATGANANAATTNSNSTEAAVAAAAVAGVMPVLHGATSNKGNAASARGDSAISSSNGQNSDSGAFIAAAAAKSQLQPAPEVAEEEDGVATTASADRSAGATAANTARRLSLIGNTSVGVSAAQPESTAASPAAPADTAAAGAPSGTNSADAEVKPHTYPPVYHDMRELLVRIAYEFKTNGGLTLSSSEYANHDDGDAVDGETEAKTNASAETTVYQLLDNAQPNINCSGNTSSGGTALYFPFFGPVAPTSTAATAAPAAHSASGRLPPLSMPTLLPGFVSLREPYESRQYRSVTAAEISKGCLQSRTERTPGSRENIPLDLLLQTLYPHSPLVIAASVDIENGVANSTHSHASTSALSGTAAKEAKAEAAAARAGAAARALASAAASNLAKESPASEPAIVTIATNAKANAGPSSSKSGKGKLNASANASNAAASGKGDNKNNKKGSSANTGTSSGKSNASDTKPAAGDASAQTAGAAPDFTVGVVYDRVFEWQFDAAAVWSQTPLLAHSGALSKSSVSDAGESANTANASVRATDAVCAVSAATHWLQQALLANAASSKSNANSGVVSSLGLQSQSRSQQQRGAFVLSPPSAGLLTATPNYSPTNATSSGLSSARRRNYLQSPSSSLSPVRHAQELLGGLISSLAAVTKEAAVASGLVSPSNSQMQSPSSHSNARSSLSNNAISIHNSATSPSSESNAAVAQVRFDTDAHDATRDNAMMALSGVSKGAAVALPVQRWVYPYLPRPLDPTVIPSLLQQMEVTRQVDAATALQSAVVIATASAISSAMALSACSDVDGKLDEHTKTANSSSLSGNANITSSAAATSAIMTVVRLGYALNTAIDALLAHKTQIASMASEGQASSSGGLLPVPAMLVSVSARLLLQQLSWLDRRSSLKLSTSAARPSTAMTKRSLNALDSRDDISELDEDEEDDEAEADDNTTSSDANSASASVSPSQGLLSSRRYRALSKDQHSLVDAYAASATGGASSSTGVRSPRTSSVDEDAVVSGCVSILPSSGVSSPADWCLLVSYVTSLAGVAGALSINEHALTVAQTKVDSASAVAAASVVTDALGLGLANASSSSSSSAPTANTSRYRGNSLNTPASGSSGVCTSTPSISMPPLSHLSSWAHLHVPAHPYTWDAAGTAAAPLPSFPQATGTATHGHDHSANAGVATTANSGAFYPFVYLRDGSLVDLTDKATVKQLYKESQLTSGSTSSPNAGANYSKSLFSVDANHLAPILVSDNINSAADATNANTDVAAALAEMCSQSLLAMANTLHSAPYLDHLSTPGLLHSVPIAVPAHSPPVPLPSLLWQPAPRSRSKRSHAAAASPSNSSGSKRHDHTEDEKDHGDDGAFDTGRDWGRGIPVPAVATQWEAGWALDRSLTHAPLVDSPSAHASDSGSFTYFEALTSALEDVFGLPNSSSTPQLTSSKVSKSASSLPHWLLWSPAFGRALTLAHSLSQSNSNNFSTALLVSGPSSGPVGSAVSGAVPSVARALAGGAVPVDATWSYATVADWVCGQACATAAATAAASAAATAATAGSLMSASAPAVCATAAVNGVSGVVVSAELVTLTVSSEDAAAMGIAPPYSGAAAGKLLEDAHLATQSEVDAMSAFVLSQIDPVGGQRLRDAIPSDLSDEAGLSSNTNDIRMNVNSENGDGTNANGFLEGQPLDRAASHVSTHSVSSPASDNGADAGLASHTASASASGGLTSFAALVEYARETVVTASASASASASQSAAAAAAAASAAAAAASAAAATSASAVNKVVTGLKRFLPGNRNNANNATSDAAPMNAASGTSEVSVSVRALKLTFADGSHAIIGAPAHVAAAYLSTLAEDGNAKSNANATGSSKSETKGKDNKAGRPSTATSSGIHDSFASSAAATAVDADDDNCENSGGNRRLNYSHYGVGSGFALGYTSAAARTGVVSLLTALRAAERTQRYLEQSLTAAAAAAFSSANAAGDTEDGQRAKRLAKGVEAALKVSRVARKWLAKGAAAGSVWALADAADSSAAKDTATISTERKSAESGDVTADSESDNDHHHNSVDAASAKSGAAKASTKDKSKPSADGKTSVDAKSSKSDKKSDKKSKKDKNAAKVSSADVALSKAILGNDSLFLPSYTLSSVSADGFQPLPLTFAAKSLKLTAGMLPIQNQLEQAEHPSEQNIVVVASGGDALRAIANAGVVARWVRVNGNTNTYNNNAHKSSSITDMGIDTNKSYNPKSKGGIRSPQSPDSLGSDSDSDSELASSPSSRLATTANQPNPSASVRAIASTIAPTNAADVAGVLLSESAPGRAALAMTAAATLAHLLKAAAAVALSSPSTMTDNKPTSIRPLINACAKAMHRVAMAAARSHSAASASVHGRHPSVPVTRVVDAPLTLASKALTPYTHAHLLVKNNSSCSSANIEACDELLTVAGAISNSNSNNNTANSAAATSTGASGAHDARFDTVSKKLSTAKFGTSSGSSSSARKAAAAEAAAAAAAAEAEAAAAALASTATAASGAAAADSVAVAAQGYLLTVSTIARVLTLMVAPNVSSPKTKTTLNTIGSSSGNVVSMSNANGPLVRAASSSGVTVAPMLSRPMLRRRIWLRGRVFIGPHSLICDCELCSLISMVSTPSCATWDWRTVITPATATAAQQRGLTSGQRGLPFTLTRVPVMCYPRLLPSIRSFLDATLASLASMLRFYVDVETVTKAVTRAQVEAWGGMPVYNTSAPLFPSAYSSSSSSSGSVTNNLGDSNGNSASGIPVAFAGASVGFSAKTGVSTSVGLAGAGLTRYSHAWLKHRLGFAYARALSVLDRGQDNFMPAFAHSHCAMHCVTECLSHCDSYVASHSDVDRGHSASTVAQVERQLAFTDAVTGGLPPPPAGAVSALALGLAVEALALAEAHAALLANTSSANATSGSNATVSAGAVLSVAVHRLDNILQQQQSQPPSHSQTQAHLHSQQQQYGKPGFGSGVNLSTPALGVSGAPPSPSDLYTFGPVSAYNAYNPNNYLLRFPPPPNFSVSTNTSHAIASGTGVAATVVPTPAKLKSFVVDWALVNKKLETVATLERFCQQQRLSLLEEEEGAEAQRRAYVKATIRNTAAAAAACGNGLSATADPVAVTAAAAAAASANDCESAHSSDVGSATSGVSGLPSLASLLQQAKAIRGVVALAAATAVARAVPYLGKESCETAMARGIAANSDCDKKDGDEDDGDEEESEDDDSSSAPADGGVIDLRRSTATGRVKGQTTSGAVDLSSAVTDYFNTSANNNNAATRTGARGRGKQGDSKGALASPDDALEDALPTHAPLPGQRGRRGNRLAALAPITALTSTAAGMNASGRNAVDNRLSQYANSHNPFANRSDKSKSSTNPFDDEVDDANSSAVRGGGNDDLYALMQQLNLPVTSNSNESGARNDSDHDSDDLMSAISNKTDTDTKTIPITIGSGHARGTTAAPSAPSSVAAAAAAVVAETIAIGRCIRHQARQASALLHSLAATEAMSNIGSSGANAHAARGSVGGSGGAGAAAATATGWAGAAGALRRLTSRSYPLLSPPAAATASASGLSYAYSQHGPEQQGQFGTASVGPQHGTYVALSARAFAELVAIAAVQLATASYNSTFAPMVLPPTLVGNAVAIDAAVAGRLGQPGGGLTLTLPPATAGFNTSVAAVSAGAAHGSVYKQPTRVQLPHATALAVLPDCVELFKGMVETYCRVSAERWALRLTEFAQSLSTAPLTVNSHVSSDSASAAVSVPAPHVQLFPTPVRVSTTASTDTQWPWLMPASLPAEPPGPNATAVTANASAATSAMAGATTVAVSAGGEGRSASALASLTLKRSAHQSKLWLSLLNTTSSVGVGSSSSGSGSGASGNVGAGVKGWVGVTVRELVTVSMPITPSASTWNKALSTSFLHNDKKKSSSTAASSALTALPVLSQTLLSVPVTVSPGAVLAVAPVLAHLLSQHDTVFNKLWSPSVTTSSGGKKSTTTADEDSNDGNEEGDEEDSEGDNNTNIGTSCDPCNKSFFIGTRIVSKVLKANARATSRLLSLMSPSACNTSSSPSTTPANPLPAPLSLPASLPADPMLLSHCIPLRFPLSLVPWRPTLSSLRAVEGIPVELLVRQPLPTAAPSWPSTSYTAADNNTHASSKNTGLGSKPGSFITGSFGHHPSSQNASSSSMFGYSSSGSPLLQPPPQLQHGGAAGQTSLPPPFALAVTTAMLHLGFAPPYASAIALAKPIANAHKLSRMFVYSLPQARASLGASGALTTALSTLYTSNASPSSSSSSTITPLSLASPVAASSSSTGSAAAVAAAAAAAASAAVGAAGAVANATQRTPFSTIALSGALPAAAGALVPPKVAGLASTVAGWGLADSVHVAIAVAQRIALAPAVQYVTNTSSYASNSAASSFSGSSSSAIANLTTSTASSAVLKQKLLPLLPFSPASLFSTIVDFSSLSSSASSGDMPTPWDAVIQMASALIIPASCANNTNANASAPSASAGGPGVITDGYGVGVVAILNEWPRRIAAIRRCIPTFIYIASKGILKLPQQFLASAFNSSNNAGNSVYGGAMFNSATSPSSKSGTNAPAEGGATDWRVVGVLLRAVCYINHLHLVLAVARGRGLSSDDISVLASLLSGTKSANKQAAALTLPLPTATANISSLGYPPHTVTLAAVPSSSGAKTNASISSVVVVPKYSLGLSSVPLETSTPLVISTTLTEYNAEPEGLTSNTLNPNANLVGGINSATGPSHEINSHFAHTAGQASTAASASTSVGLPVHTAVTSYVLESHPASAATSTTANANTPGNSAFTSALGGAHSSGTLQQQQVAQPKQVQIKARTTLAIPDVFNAVAAHGPGAVLSDMDSALRRLTTPSQSQTSAAAGPYALAPVSHFDDITAHPHSATLHYNKFQSLALTGVRPLFMNSNSTAQNASGASSAAGGDANSGSFDPAPLYQAMRLSLELHDELYRKLGRRVGLHRKGAAAPALLTATVTAGAAAAGAVSASNSRILYIAALAKIRRGYNLRHESNDDEHDGDSSKAAYNGVALLRHVGTMSIPRPPLPGYVQSTIGTYVPESATAALSSPLPLQLDWPLHSLLYMLRLDCVANLERTVRTACEGEVRTVSDSELGLTLSPLVAALMRHIAFSGNSLSGTSASNHSFTGVETLPSFATPNRGVVLAAAARMLECTLPPPVSSYTGISPANNTSANTSSSSSAGIFPVPPIATQVNIPVPGSKAAKRAEAAAAAFAAPDSKSRQTGPGGALGKPGASPPTGRTLSSVKSWFSSLTTTSATANNPNNANSGAVANAAQGRGGDNNTEDQDQDADQDEDNSGNSNADLSKRTYTEHPYIPRLARSTYINSLLLPLTSEPYVWSVPPAEAAAARAAAARAAAGTAVAAALDGTNANGAEPDQDEDIEPEPPLPPTFTLSSVETVFSLIKAQLGGAASLCVHHPATLAALTMDLLQVLEVYPSHLTRLLASPLAVPMPSAGLPGGVIAPLPTTSSAGNTSSSSITSNANINSGMRSPSSAATSLSTSAGGVAPRPMSRVASTNVAPLALSVATNIATLPAGLIVANSGTAHCHLPHTHATAAAAPASAAPPTTATATNATMTPVQSLADAAATDAAFAKAGVTGINSHSGAVAALRATPEGEIIAATGPGTGAKHLAPVTAAEAHQVFASVISSPHSKDAGAAALTVAAETLAYNTMATATACVSSSNSSVDSVFSWRHASPLAPGFSLSSTASARAAVVAAQVLAEEARLVCLENKGVRIGWSSNNTKSGASRSNTVNTVNNSSADSKSAVQWRAGASVTLMKVLGVAEGRVGGLRYIHMPAAANPGREPDSSDTHKDRRNSGYGSNRHSNAKMKPAYNESSDSDDANDEDALSGSKYRVVMIGDSEIMAVMFNNFSHQYPVYLANTNDTSSASADDVHSLYNSLLSGTTNNASNALTRSRNNSGHASRVVTIKIPLPSPLPIPCPLPPAASRGPTVYRADYLPLVTALSVAHTATATIAHVTALLDYVATLADDGKLSRPPPRVAMLGVCDECDGKGCVGAADGVPAKLSLLTPIAFSASSSAARSRHAGVSHVCANCNGLGLAAAAAGTSTAVAAKRARAARFEQLLLQTRGRAGVPLGATATAAVPPSGGSSNDQLCRQPWCCRATQRCPAVSFAFKSLAFAPGTTTNSELAAIVSNGSSSIVSVNAFNNAFVNPVGYSQLSDAGTVTNSGSTTIASTGASSTGAMAHYLNTYTQHKCSVSSSACSNSSNKANACELLSALASRGTHREAVEGGLLPRNSNTLYYADSINAGDSGVTADAESVVERDYCCACCVTKDIVKNHNNVELSNGVAPSSAKGGLTFSAPYVGRDARLVRLDLLASRLGTCVAHSLSTMAMLLLPRLTAVSAWWVRVVGKKLLKLQQKQLQRKQRKQQLLTMRQQQHGASGVTQVQPLLSVVPSHGKSKGLSAEAQAEAEAKAAEAAEAAAAAAAEAEDLLAFYGITRTTSNTNTGATTNASHSAADGDGESESDDEEADRVAVRASVELLSKGLRYALCGYSTVLTNNDSDSDSGSDSESDSDSEDGYESDYESEPEPEADAIAIPEAMTTSSNPFENDNEASHVAGDTNANADASTSLYGQSTNPFDTLPASRADRRTQNQESARTNPFDDDDNDDADQANISTNPFEHTNDGDDNESLPTTSPGAKGEDDDDEDLASVFANKKTVAVTKTTLSAMFAPTNSSHFNTMNSSTAVKPQVTQLKPAQSQVAQRKSMSSRKVMPLDPTTRAAKTRTKASRQKRATHTSAFGLSASAAKQPLTESPEVSYAVISALLIPGSPMHLAFATLLATEVIPAVLKGALSALRPGGFANTQPLQATLLDGVSVNPMDHEAEGMSAAAKLRSMVPAAVAFTQSPAASTVSTASGGTHGVSKSKSAAGVTVPVAHSLVLPSLLSFISQSLVSVLHSVPATLATCDPDPCPSAESNCSVYVNTFNKGVTTASYPGLAPKDKRLAVRLWRALDSSLAPLLALWGTGSQAAADAQNQTASASASAKSERKRLLATAATSPVAAVAVAVGLVRAAAAVADADSDEQGVEAEGESDNGTWGVGMSASERSAHFQFALFTTLLQRHKVKPGCVEWMARMGGSETGEAVALASKYAKFVQAKGVGSDALHDVLGMGV